MNHKRAKKRSSKSEKVKKEHRECGKIGSIKKRVDNKSRVRSIGTHLEKSGTMGQRGKKD